MKKLISIALILVLTLSLFAGCRRNTSDETSMPTNATTTMPSTTQMPTTTQNPSTVPSTGDSGITEIPAPTGTVPSESGRSRIPSARMK